MSKNIFTLFFLFICIPISISAQQKSANIAFDESIHNFGDIKEADGKALYKFEFTNTGSEPLKIHRVTASCGCTTPGWTKEPIMPGEKGFVSAEYNPAHRPGKFTKTITVTSNSATPTVRLKITGNVIPKPLSIEEQYRYDFGGIRLKVNHLSFGTVYKGQEKTKAIEIINNSDSKKTIDIKNVPKHLKINVLTPKLGPREKGSIEVTYLSELQPKWDFVMDRVNLLVDGESISNNRLVISASLQEDFSALTPEQKANAPKMIFDEKVFNFGKLNQGEKAEHTYTFVNKGKSDLIIRNVRASCGCTAINTSSNLIKPGESGSIKATFNSSGKFGNQNKTITLITNDPDHSREILWIKGTVVKE